MQEGCGGRCLLFANNLPTSNVKWMPNVSSGEMFIEARPLLVENHHGCRLGRVNEVT